MLNFKTYFHLLRLENANIAHLTSKCTLSGKGRWFIINLSIIVSPTLHSFFVTLE